MDSDYPDCYDQRPFSPSPFYRPSSIDYGSVSACPKKANGMMHIVFGRVRPVTAKQRRFYLWLEFGRYLSCAAVSAYFLWEAAASGPVPREFVSVLVATTAAVPASACSLCAVLLALRDREPRLALRAALVVWCTGIFATVLTVLAVAASTKDTLVFLTALFTIPPLVFAKPPSTRARAGLFPPLWKPSSRRGRRPPQ